MKELTTAPTVGKGHVRNRLTVRCQTCGRSVKRQAHHQRYCSDRCRVYAQREKTRSQINARTAIKNPAEYQHSGAVTGDVFLSNKVNELQGQKSGSSTPRNILGGYRWPNAPEVDRDLLRKIVRLEVGDR
jgi:hypothetical protein